MTLVFISFLSFYYLKFANVVLLKEDLWFIVVLTWVYYFVNEISKDNSNDIYLLKFLVWVGSLTIILSSNLIYIYIGLEIQTFSLFVLISKNKNNIKSSEAGLKYFILGAISSGFYLLSTITLYSLFHSIDLTYLSLNHYDSNYYYGLILVLSLSLFFKLTLFPLHFWIPDIYEGSSSDIISFIASLPKISVLCLIIKLNLSSYLLLYVGLISIMIGCLAGLNQTKVKRLFAYSSIAHLGFTVIGLSLYNVIGVNIGIIYFILYLLSSLGLIFLLISFSQEDIYIIELGGMNYFHSLWSILWISLFLSLAGLPPLLGFLGKWWIIVNLMNSNFIISTLIIILLSCISIAFYLRITKIIYFQSYSSYLIWHSVLRPKKLINNSYYIINFLLYISLFGILVPNVWSSLSYIFLY